MKKCEASIYLRFCKGEEECRKAKCPGDHIVSATEKEYLGYINAIANAQALVESWKK